MSSFSDYTENLVLNWLFTTNSATRPTAWFVGLFTAAPSDSGGGTEVSGSGYARVATGTMSVSGTSPTNCTNSAAIPTRQPHEPRGRPVNNGLGIHHRPAKQFAGYLGERAPDVKRIII